ncbi:SulP family inorganic anion transporter [Iamia sp. SCSIO 61187]|uniref:SulP family inorganic anion transporter n=1 Tax=Iamia sp. SCSIO 61187 TaxID=2722752 RepID=UPI002103F9F8|nr:sulfate permease [Iamia sp. SCSIO 61187]
MLRRYQSAWLGADLLAGLTVGAMLIPQSMAYAALAGLPPEYGFYAVIGALVVYALVGTSRHLGVGPEPGTAVLAALGVSSIAAGDRERYVALMAALALLVAAICVVGAVARLGFLASLLSKPVLVGYITGVGLTLLSSQLAGLTGAPLESDTLFSRFRELLSELDQVRPASLLLGVATLALMVGLRAAAPRVPGALVAVVMATVVTAAFGLAQQGVAVVGTIPGGLPIPGIPDVSLADLGKLLPVAAGIALVGYTDNVLTARSVAARHGYRVDPNQELLALGLTNLTAGLSRGFPISSSASRTAVPASLGSRTQLASIVASAFVVATLLGLRPLLSEIPRAALAAVILAAAITIIDAAGMVALWRTGRDEASLALATAFGVVVFGVLAGVLVAVVLSVVMALYRIARPHDAVLGDYPALDGWVEVDAHSQAETEPGLVVYRFDAPLFFLNAERFSERVKQVLSDNPGDEDWLVLDFEGIGSLDATATETLAELVEEVAGCGVGVVAIARANSTVMGRLLRARLIEPEGHLRSFPTINGAVAAYRSRHDG